MLRHPQKRVKRSVDLGSCLPLNPRACPRQGPQNPSAALSYIAVTFNHFRALQRWAAAHAAEAWLDMKDFHVEIRRGEDFCRLHPQFLTKTNGALCYTPNLTDNVLGFIGWLPYRPLSWPLSTDKLSFKRFAQESGLRTPARWEDFRAANRDYVIKRSVGSFGTAVFGPFRAGDVDAASRIVPEGPGTAFAEQFVPGRNVKLWYWGDTVFHAHVHDYACVVGDGLATVTALIERKLEQLGRPMPGAAEWQVVVSCLAYHGLRPDDVLTHGKDIWVDFRYGRTLDPDPAQSTSDDMLSTLTPAARDQAKEMGRKLGAELLMTHPVPLLYAMDAVMDTHGDLWWLEANSNPVFPPTGYPLMLATLFDTSRESAVDAKVAAPAL